MRVGKIKLDIFNENKYLRILKISSSIECVTFTITLQKRGCVILILPQGFMRHVNWMPVVWNMGSPSWLDIKIMVKAWHKMWCAAHYCKLRFFCEGPYKLTKGEFLLKQIHKKTKLYIKWNRHQMIGRIEYHSFKVVVVWITNLTNYCRVRDLNL